MPMRARFVSSLCLAMCGELVSRAEPGNVSVGIVQPAAGAVAGDDLALIAAVSSTFEVVRRGHGCRLSR